MDRKTYYAAHRDVRCAARSLALMDGERRSASHPFDHAGHRAMIFAARVPKAGTRETSGDPARIVVRTIADRPLRARVAEELAHAAECRRSASSWHVHPAIQALRIREARRTIEIVRDLFSAFNHLPA